MVRDGGFLSLFGFPPAIEELYWHFLSLSGQPLEVIAEALGREAADVEADIEPLTKLRVISVAPQAVDTRSPADALALFVRAQALHAERLTRRLDAVAAAVGALPTQAPPLGEGGRPLDGEVLGQVDVAGMLERWVRHSHGDLLWLRPDQWRMSSDQLMTSAVAEAVATGRQSRAIYPTAALTVAPDAIQARVQAGEQVRVAPEIPTRLAIIGPQAVLHDHHGVGSAQRLLVRQPSLVSALRVLFEQLWERATPVTDVRVRRRRDARRLLVDHLAAGEKDEQIARALGVSLRTVRRRIAAMMTELGVDSRFQAGVEAARQGWL
ncbi:MAG: helix-turn-helix domain-containing protein [Nocardioides sp.]